MKVIEYNKRTLNKPNEKTPELIKKLQKEHSKLIKGKFEFLDADGGWLDFCYRFFKDDPLMKMTLVHGEVCEIPIGIVKHLNNCVKKVRKLGPMGEDGKAPYSMEYTSRVRFTPLEVL